MLTPPTPSQIPFLSVQFVLLTLVVELVMLDVLLLAVVLVVFEELEVVFEVELDIVEFVSLVYVLLDSIVAFV